jgi:Ni/Fe-hydrogenase subunit HybB-like protein
MRGLLNLVFTVALVLTVVAFLQILPDLKRYLRIHKM